MNFTGGILKTWTQALMLSSSTVSFFVFTLGIGILPFNAGDIWPKAVLSITDCILWDGGRLAVSTVWTHDRNGRRDRLIIYSLNESKQTIEYVWPNLVPRFLAGDSPRGVVYVLDRDGVIYSVDPSHPAKPPVFIVRHPTGDVRQLACSPDGRWLASIHEDSLFVWNVASKSLHHVVADLRLQCLAFSPDSRRMACGLADGDVIEMQVATGRPLRGVTQHPHPITRVAYCPQGQRLVSLCYRGQLQLTDLKTGTVIWKRPQGSSPPALSFSHNGEIVISSGRVGSKQGLIAYHTQTGNRLAAIEGHGGEIRGLRFGCRGGLLAWGADGTVRLWDQFGIRESEGRGNPARPFLFDSGVRIIRVGSDGLAQCIRRSVASS